MYIEVLFLPYSLYVRESFWKKVCNYINEKKYARKLKKTRFSMPNLRADVILM